jgi:hypothetical protein
MDEQTVNEAPLFEASDVEPVANDSSAEQAEDMGSSAVEANVEQTTSENEASEQPAATEEQAQTGDAIDEFLAKKGIKADDPDAVRKIAEMYQNVEKGFYNKSQEKAQLERKLAEARVPEIRPDQEALSEVRAMRTEMTVEKWKAGRNLSPEDEQKMIEFVQTPITDVNGNVQVNPTTGQPITKGMLVLNGVLSLDDVYALSGAGKVEVDSLKENLRKEVQKEMEARQAAKRPSSNATDSTKFGNADADDPFSSALLGN